VLRIRKEEKKDRLHSAGAVLEEGQNRPSGDLCGLLGEAKP
jgi:hypothetical protein